jgi:AcrR family transcriptional regulator
VTAKPSARRRRLDPDVRREQLLATAMRVVNRRGACRIEDVTSAAHVAKGTFYLYFPSWEHLLIAMRERLLERYARETEDKFAAVDRATWRSSCEAECVRFVDFVVGLGGLHTALFHGPIADRPIPEERSARHVIARLLRHGMELGAMEELDIDACAALLFAVLHSTADQIARGGDRERLVGVMRQLIGRWLWRNSPESKNVAVRRTLRLARVRHENDSF